MNGSRVALLQLAAAEEWTYEETEAEFRAASELSMLAAIPDADVNIIRPILSDEPWRAEIREGKVPGEGCHTSGFLVAERPSELLAKLEKMFTPSDPDDAPG